MTDEDELKNEILNAWGLIDVPNPQDLKYVRFEESEEVYEFFAGKKISELELKADVLEFGFPLLSMNKNAAAYYIGIYMMSILDSVQARLKGEFVLDHRSQAHLFGTLSDPEFIVNSLLKFLGEKQISLVLKFINFCVTNQHAVSLNDGELQELEFSANKSGLRPLLRPGNQ